MIPSHLGANSGSNMGSNMGTGVMKGDQSSFIGDALSGNPYFTAGFGLLGVGAGLSLLRQGATRFAYLLQRKYLSSLEISAKDPSYYWVLQWLTKSTLRSGNHFSVQTIRLQSTDGASHKLASHLVPSPGVHYIRWKGHWIKASREREKGALLDISTGVPFETIKLTMIGKSHAPFMKILEEARADEAAQTEGKLMLYTSFANEWRPFGTPRRRRPLQSVILADGIAEGLMSDIKEFLGSGKWYQDRGIPYRRGYMLYGPPGTGKSSMVQAIAGELGYSICLLSLADGMVTDDRLNHLLSVLPEKSVLLLEDVDAVSLETSMQHGLSRLTLSGLLNALDGVGSSEERLIFMTTNHYDKLAPALIRPGRIDVKYLIDLADAGQIRRMFERFYPGQAELAGQFVEALGGRKLSPATIQGHFIQHKESAAEAVRMASDLVDHQIKSAASG